MATRPNEDDYQRIVWGQPPEQVPDTLSSSANPATPADGPQAASGQLGAADSPQGPFPADRAWTCRWCHRHHAWVHGDRSPWPDQDTFVMVARDVRQWLPVAAYPAEAVYTVRDRYAMMLAEIMAYGWPEDRKVLQAFRLADAWCMCLPARPKRWWKMRDGSYG